MSAGRGTPSAGRILVVDDEAVLVRLVTDYLLREGYEVLAAGDGVTALDLARAERPDLIILDLMLPGLDGFEVCRRLREFSSAYILMLTAKAEEMDKVVGLTIGADDYLTKPFSLRELVARVKALLRRGRAGVPQGDQPPPAQQLGELVIDRERYEVTLRGRPVPLTPREFQLLATLAEHAGRVLTRSRLLEGVWEDRAYDEHIVEVYVANLRRKLETDPSHPRYIKTVRGVGYRISEGA